MRTSEIKIPRKCPACDKDKVAVVVVVKPMVGGYDCCGEIFLCRRCSDKLPGVVEKNKLEQMNDWWW